LERDAIGIPKLSATAMAVLETVHCVRAERPGDPWHLSRRIAVPLWRRQV
jgi:hypothetical protein